MKSVIFIVGFFIFLFQVIAVGSPSIAESELSTMTTEPKYAVRVNDLQSPAEAEKVTKIICNGKMVQFFFQVTLPLLVLGFLPQFTQEITGISRYKLIFKI